MSIGTAGAILTVDLGAVRRNYRAVRAAFGGAEVAGVVKANAYGLGIDALAPALAHEGCRTFFVATAAEAFELRALLPDAAIHVFDGIQPGEEADFAEQRILPVLNSLQQIELWRALALAKGRRLPADLHLDTGMSRLGLDTAEQKRLLARPDHLKGIELDAVISHLAVAEDPSNPMNEAQRMAFAGIAGGLPGRRLSLANSSGVFLGAAFHFDLARVGVALYGANPTPGAPSPVAQVIRLQGRILQVRSVDAARSVGYGATHRVSRPSRIATVALGYADGYPLAMSNLGTAFLDNHEIPVVGRVSMDLTTVDVTDLPEGLAAPGRLVDFIGADNSIDAVAARAKTIPYTILTGLGRRLHRIYLDEDR
jgi:alanine racemase